MRSGPFPVLLVEDEDALRDLYAERMREAGLLVYEARGVREAIKIYEKRRPGIACVDGRLPDGSGADLAREIGLRGTRVILITNDQDLYEDPPAGVELAVLKINLSPAALAAAVRGLVR